jgi:hypothetical protein
MNTGKTLEEINDPNKINQAISKDEEAEKGTLRALRWAEQLIIQLPTDHPGRAEWLKQFGEQEEASLLRRERDRPI